MPAGSHAAWSPHRSMGPESSGNGCTTRQIQEFVPAAVPVPESDRWRELVARQAANRPVATPRSVRQAPSWGAGAGSASSQHGVGPGPAPAAKHTAAHAASESAKSHRSRGGIVDLADLAAVLPESQPTTAAAPAAARHHAKRRSRKKRHRKQEVVAPFSKDGWGGGASLGPTLFGVPVQQRSLVLLTMPRPPAPTTLAHVPASSQGNRGIVPANVFARTRDGGWSTTVPAAAPAGLSGQTVTGQHTTREQDDASKHRAAAAKAAEAAKQPNDRQREAAKPDAATVTALQARGSIVEEMLASAQSTASDAAEHDAVAVAEPAKDEPAPDGPVVAQAAPAQEAAVPSQAAEPPLRGAVHKPRKKVGGRADRTLIRADSDSDLDLDLERIVADTSGTSPVVAPQAAAAVSPPPVSLPMAATSTASPRSQDVRNVIARARRRFTVAGSQFKRGHIEAMLSMPAPSRTLLTELSQHMSSRLKGVARGARCRRFLRASIKFCKQVRPAGSHVGGSPPPTMSHVCVCVFRCSRCAVPSCSGGISGRRLYPVSGRTSSRSGTALSAT